eukprot:444707_1
MRLMPLFAAMVHVSFLLWLVRCLMPSFLCTILLVSVPTVLWLVLRFTVFLCGFLLLHQLLLVRVYFIEASVYFIEIAMFLVFALVVSAISPFIFLPINPRTFAAVLKSICVQYQIEFVLSMNTGFFDINGIGMIFFHSQWLVH